MNALPPRDPYWRNGWMTTKPVFINGDESPGSGCFISWVQPRNSEIFRSVMWDERRVGAKKEANQEPLK